VFWNTHQSSDSLIVATHRLTTAEINAGVGVSGQRMIELIDSRTGAGTGIATLSEGRTGGFFGAHTVGAPACTTGRGDRIVLMRTAFRAQGSDVDEHRVWAHVHAAGGTWRAAVLLGGLVGGNNTPDMRLACGADAAFVKWQNQGGDLCGTSTYSATAQTWSGGPVCSTTNQLTRAISWGSAFAGNVGALVSWTDYRSDPKGVAAVEGTTPLTYYAGVPRLFENVAGSARWVSVPGIPGYQSGSTHDAAVGGFMYIPGSNIYLGSIRSGLVGETKGGWITYSTVRGWSNVWSGQDASGFDGFQFGSATFNNNGRGASVGLRDGQTYVSFWP
jgi:hypothetical protein